MTITIKALKDSIDRLENSLSLVKKQYKEYSEKQANLHKHGDSVFYINSAGRVDKTYFTSNAFCADLTEIGNVYKTRLEALYVVDVRKAKTKVLARIKELNDGWSPEGNQSDKRRAVLSHINKTNTVLVSCTSTDMQSVPGSHYFEHAHHLTTLVEEFGENTVQLALIGANNPHHI
jgi:hypothetical protein